MNTFDLLNNLTELRCVSGCESQALNFIKNQLSYARIEQSIGGIYATIGNKDNNAPHILIDAHIDSIGFRVTSITDDGFVRVDKCGGIDKRLVPSQKVIICSESKEIPGVFCSTPPHLSNFSDEVCEISSMYIDTGMSKEDVKKFVKLGDCVVFDTHLRKMSGSCVSSGALDNRSGCCAAIKSLDLLKSENIYVTAIFSNQEEIGLRGAKTAAFSDDYDYVICLDVSFAYTKGEDRKKCGELHKGAMIGISPILDKNLSNIIIDTAKNNFIPYQIEVMSESTSTNADVYSITKYGIKTALISIPLKYMHTPTEVCSIDDIENTAALVCEVVKKLSEKN